MALIVTSGSSIHSDVSKIQNDLTLPQMLLMFMSEAPYETFQLIITFCEYLNIRT